MPRPRFHKLESDKQDRIIDAAGAEFARHGYQSASLNAIIDTAGISKGAFYYYFDDKADLFATVLERAREAIFIDMPDFERLGRQDYWSSLSEAVNRSIAFSSSHPWIYELSATLHQRPDEFGEPLERFLCESNEFARRYLMRGQELGLVRDDVPFEALLTMVSAIDRSLDAWFGANWQRFDFAEISRISDNILDMMRSMLSPPNLDVD